MDDILRRAEELGRAMREHPRYKRLLEADGRVRADKAATGALEAYNKAVLAIAEKQHRQQPIEVEEKRDVERLRQAVVANETVKAFMRAQADYAELMKRMNDAIYGELRPPGEGADPETELHADA
ncbi:MAG: YlbF family regulator [Phycisphaerae bacterium]|nr:YlbF family regulator [Phycisphaerae bacterium]